MATGQESTPRSSSNTLDPTPRTLESMGLSIKALDDKFSVEFKGYDKAIKLLQDFADKAPTTSEVAGDVRGLKDLVLEKFSSVKSQFEQNDKALTAALNAAEKAVKEQNTSNTTAIDKSEKGFKELLNALGSRVDAVEKAADGKITDIKEALNKLESRVITMESRANGMTVANAEQRDKSKDNSSFTFSIIAAIFGFVGMIASITAIVVVVSKVG